MRKYILFTIILIVFFGACNKSSLKQNNDEQQNVVKNIEKIELDVDLSKLSPNQKQVVKLLIKASEYIDSMFFYENIENYDEVFNKIKDSELKEKFKYNFGPWDRFNNNVSFIKDVEKKPLGGNFYPKDISKNEFFAFNDSCKNSPFTFIRRNEKGKLFCVEYHVQFKKYIQKISILLDSAADLSENNDFSNYLRERIKALKTDNYIKSDSLWLSMRDNTLDFIIGPVYILEDKFLNIKAEHQSFLLVKDTAWTLKMELFNKWLRYLQKAIPVPEIYRAEEPGTSSSIEVYNAIYFGGSGKTGGTLLSVVFPINPEIQIKLGVRNLLFENVMDYKFSSIAKPIAKEVLVDYQGLYITSDAFFINSLLFEMANSLGVRNTIDKKTTVRNALKEYFLISDYLKNISLSLFLAEKLFEIGEIKTDLKENYFTMVVDLLRLIRFGESNNYAISNLVCYNYFVENKAIYYDKEGEIIINYENMRNANKKLIEKIIILQGDGNYTGMKKFLNKYNYIDDNLQKTIDRINLKQVPTDIQLVEGDNILKF